MIAVFYDDACDALWVSFRLDPFMPGTLKAELDGDMITIRRCVGDSVLVGQTFDQFTRWDGTGFTDAATALAYLQGEFAKRRLVGDLHAVPVAIAESGQTQIPLLQPPSLPATLRLEVNGVTYRPPDIAISDVLVIWANETFPLDPADTVAVVYS